jgi:hypothetical protein
MNFKQWLIKESSESSESSEIFQDANKNRYKIIKIQNGYQAYYSQHDDDEFELELEDVKYSDTNTTESALIQKVKSVIQQTYKIISKTENEFFRNEHGYYNPRILGQRPRLIPDAPISKELAEELTEQLRNTAVIIQILTEYMTILEAQFLRQGKSTTTIKTIIGELTNISTQTMTIADDFEEDKNKEDKVKRKTSSENTSDMSGVFITADDESNLLRLSRLMQTITTSVKTVSDLIVGNENYANLTASIGITYESYELPDSTRNKACAFNSVSIYEDNIQEIKNPTEQEMISILKSIMGDKSNLDYIESIVTRKCR